MGNHDQTNTRSAMYECTHWDYMVSYDKHDPSYGLKWCQICGKRETFDKRETWPLSLDAPYRAKATLAQHFAMLSDTQSNQMSYDKDTEARFKNIDHAIAQLAAEIGLLRWFAERTGEKLRGLCIEQNEFNKRIKAVEDSP